MLSAMKRVEMKQDTTSAMSKTAVTRKTTDRVTSLLSVARKRFSAQGYAGTTLGDVAEDAGIRKASLYYHFPTKEALYTAVIDQIVTGLCESIARASAGDDGFVERLDRLGAEIVEYLGSNREAACMLLREMVGDSVYIRGPGGEVVEATLKDTAAFLRAGMDSGAFSRQNEAQLALSIIGLHLYYFAAPKMSRILVGCSIFTKAAVEDRSRALRQHVRALCGAPPLP
jgi:AcrR family transcriptional regulator